MDPPEKLEAGHEQHGSDGVGLPCSTLITAPLLQSEDSEQLNGDSWASCNVALDSDNSSPAKKTADAEKSFRPCHLTSMGRKSQDRDKQFQSKQPSRASSAISYDDDGDTSQTLTVPLLRSDDSGQLKEEDSSDSEENTADGEKSHGLICLQTSTERKSQDNKFKQLSRASSERSQQPQVDIDVESNKEENEEPPKENEEPPKIYCHKFRWLSPKISTARRPQLDRCKKFRRLSIATSERSGQPQVAIDVEVDKEEENEELQKKELQKKIARIVSKKDLISLRELGGAGSVALAFDSNLESGRDTGSGKSIVAYKNGIIKDYLGFFLQACNKYSIFLLIISGCCSLVFEMIENSPKHGWHDGAETFIAVSLMVCANSVSSCWEARKLEEDWSKQRRIDVKVKRCGQIVSVPIFDIVEGDLVFLDKGQTVPADGLLVAGSLEMDGRTDKNIDCGQNPFLFSGSRIDAGDGHMLVTSVGSDAVSLKEPLLEDRISKPNEYAEMFSLFMGLTIVIALFLRFVHNKHEHHAEESSPTKGKVTVPGISKIFERMILKPRVAVSTLTSFLAVVMIGIQHGMPLVISMSLAYWNEKKRTDEVDPKKSSACGTMGLVTVIFIDISGGLTGGEAAELELRSLEEAVAKFKSAKIDVKLVSGEDELPTLATARKLGILDLHSSDDQAITGQVIRDLSPDELKTQADRIKVMANFLPKDKLRMVQCLKENGHVVAFYGGSTARDDLVLKEADVGISDKGSTQIAKNNSEITINSHRSFLRLISICRCGRWLYLDIQNFIQLQLTVMVSSLVAASLATMALGESPITLIHLISVNLISPILGGLMLVVEHQNQELHTLQPAGDRNEPAIPKAAWICILTQIAYQASLFLVVLIKGQSIPGINESKAGIIIIWAMCQVFNYVNAIELERNWRDWEKRKAFLLVAAAAQVAVLVVVAKTKESLSWVELACCFLLAATTWGLGCAMKSFSPFMLKSFTSISSHLGRSGWMCSRHAICFVAR